MRPRSTLVFVLVCLLSLGSGCAGPPRGAVDEQAGSEFRYNALRSCLTDLGLKGGSTETGAWPRSLVMLSDKAMVNARVFRTHDDARAAAEEFRKDEAAYLKRGRDLGIGDPPTSPSLLGDRVFARYITRGGLGPAVTRCIRG